MLGRSLGHYLVVAPLGSGGMGQVWRARDSHLDRDVAIKVLPPELFADPDARRRFRREAFDLSRARHPHIAVVHDFAEEGGVPYLVMELVEGEPLSDALARGPFPESETRRIGSAIASALGVAHERGIVHRDLKPGNVMLGERGEVKVLDFGIAKRIPTGAPAHLTTKLTVTGDLMGTPAYAAPEQLLSRPVDGRTDLFALGAVLYEMITGARPFQGDTAIGLANSILNETPAAPRVLAPRCSESLESIIVRCLSKRPEQRFASAAALIESLEAPAGVGPPPATPVTPVAPDPPARRARLRWNVAAVIASSVAVVVVAGTLLVPRLVSRGPVGIRSVVVLPLVNLSRDPEQEYFVDGMTDELIVTLSQIGAIKVISRSSSMAYKSTEKPARQIARELHVDALVSGSVQRAGSRLRVRAQLVHGGQDVTLWADAFERELSDILVLQRDIARAIVDRIHVQLDPRAAQRLASARRVNPEAHEEYLRGRHWWNQFTSEGWLKSREHFKRAIEIDSSYAPAFAGLADAYIMLGANVLDPREALAPARAAIRKALELDPDLAAGHAALGYMQANFDHAWAPAEASFRRALEINPHEVTALQNYGYLLHVNGRFDEALVQFRHAREIDPLSPYVAAMTLWPLNQGRRYAQAIAEARRQLAADSTGWYTRFILAQALSCSGRHAEGIAEFEKVTAVEDLPILRAWLGWGYARGGRRAEAERILAAYESARQSGFVHPYGFALLHVALGHRDEALDWLETCERTPVEEVVFVYVDPAMDPLRSEPRFQALVHRLGLGRAQRPRRRRLRFGAGSSILPGRLPPPGLRPAHARVTGFRSGKEPAMGLIEKIEAAHMKEGRPELRPGYTVEVAVRVIEGDKERQQKFRGEIINVRGAGMRRTFTVRKISEGIGVERTFPFHGPSIADIKVIRHSKVRRAKLFYLRRKTGKAARLTEKSSGPGDTSKS